MLQQQAYSEACTTATIMVNYAAYRQKTNGMLKSIKLQAQT